MLCCYLKIIYWFPIKIWCCDLKSKRVDDHILMLLAIKPPGKLVELDHILEKVGRNSGSSREEIISTLKDLIKQGLVMMRENKYSITEEGRRKAWSLVYDPDMVLSYRLVLLARFYYPKISGLILPFLKNRPVSVVKVFSDENDPINKIKPIFSRYKKAKPKIYNFINTRDDLMRYVDMHAIDFIPYVHKLNQNHPDWLVIDIDAGEAIKNAGSLGFNLIKEVTKETYIIMNDILNLNPCIKFSGSRGFQIWVSFIKPLGNFDDYRKSISVIRDLVENSIKGKIDDLKEKYGSLISEPLTTSTVAKKEKRKNQILLDPSSMKEEGDVRAPWSMHHKTGLVSVPVHFSNLEKFTPDNARVEIVVENHEYLQEAFHLEPSDPSKLIKYLGKGGLLKFIS